MGFIAFNSYSYQACSSAYYKQNQRLTSMIYAQKGALKNKI